MVTGSGSGCSLLLSLENSELLTSYNELYEGKIRRYHKITPNGRQLKRAKLQLMELMGKYSRKRK
jgi:hypothetical protein